MATKTEVKKKILVYGIGNPGRQDDGLGPAFIERLEQEKLEGLVLEANYQFQVEDTLLFSEFQKVIVVDALKKGKRPFIFKKIRPQKKFTFTTHALPAEAVVYLTKSLYGHSPEVYLLAIQGYEFEVGEGLTPAARQNLEQALAFFKENIS